MLVAHSVSSSSFSHPGEQHDVWDNMLEVEGFTSNQSAGSMSTFLNLLMDLDVVIALPGRADIFSILYGLTHQVPLAMEYHHCYIHEDVLLKIN